MQRTTRALSLGFLVAMIVACSEQVRAGVPSADHDGVYLASGNSRVVNQMPRAVSKMRVAPYAATTLSLTDDGARGELQTPELVAELKKQYLQERTQTESSSCRYAVQCDDANPATCDESSIDGGCVHRPYAPSLSRYADVCRMYR